MKNKIAIAVTLLLLSSCADSNPSFDMSGADAIGFWHGLWHGWILPVSWLFSLWDPGIAVYSVANSGALYDLGFLLGVGSGFKLVIRVPKTKG